MRRRLPVRRLGIIGRELDETKLADEWARANPTTARRVLASPPPASKPPCLESLERYSRARGFAIPEDEPARMHSLRLLSHALSYPLTLAAYAKKSSIAREGALLRVAIVGARAESSLPMSAWAELAHALPRVFRWNIFLLGSQVVPTRRLAGVANVANVAVTCRRAELAARDELAALCAQAFDEEENDGIDIVALFNPGLGHHRLEAGWRGALRSVYRARPRALLVTSFSQSDQDSDISGLFRICRTNGAAEPDFLIPPERNPFSSRRHFLDPCDPRHLTAANERAFVVCLPSSSSSSKPTT